MASIFSHAIASVALGKASPLHASNLKFWLLAIFCAVVPDADVIAFDFGIPYSSMWGHRGITHSIFFSVLLGILVTCLAYRKIPLGSKKWWGYASFFAAATLSHALLDAMTNGGLGVAIFAPFENSRYFLPYRPIQVSPLGVAKFFSEWGYRVLRSEFVWIWLPSLSVLLLRFLSIKIDKVS